MTDVSKGALFPKLIHQMMTVFRHGFEAEITLPLAQSAPVVPLDFVGLSSLYGIAISLLVQLKSYLGFFYVFALV